MSTPTRIFDRLVEIALLFEADLARSFAGTALTTSRTHLLWVLHHAGPSTQRALAETLSVSPSQCHRTGRRARAAAGYVERRSHPSDRRATLVTLTELGTETMTGMARDREQAAGQLLGGVAADRLEELDQDLGRIAERLHELVEAPARLGRPA